MNLKEIKKMVVTSLIQERVGYHGSQDGGAGEPADAPDINGIVATAEKEMTQLVAAQDNVLGAIATEIAELAAPILVQSGVASDVVTKMVSDFLEEMHEAVKKAKEAKDGIVVEPTPENQEVEMESD